MDLLIYLRNQWDRVGAWVAIGLGALLLFVGWLGVSDTVLPSEQLPYIISGGLGGFFLLGIGAMLWISADLRDEWRKLDDLDRTWAGLTTEAHESDEPKTSAAANGSGATTRNHGVPDRDTLVSQQEG